MIDEASVNEELLADLIEFGSLQVQSRDIDPVYPVLWCLMSKMGLTEESALWLLLLYVAYYNLPSALCAFEAYPDGPPVDMDPMIAELPCGVERRGLRGGVGMIRHVKSLNTLSVFMGSLKAWLWEGLEVAQGPDGRWNQIIKNVEQAWGNGRWASYKTAELLQKVMKWPLEPSDMGHAASTGPRKGLALLYGGDVPGDGEAAIAALDLRSEELLELMMSHGLDVDLAGAETILCDFKSLHDGRYYVGHDIDQLQEQIQESIAPDDIKQNLWGARREALPLEYLGEIGGWRGVEKDRKTIYQKDGSIVYR